MEYNTGKERKVHKKDIGTNERSKTKGPTGTSAQDDVGKGGRMDTGLGRRSRYKRLRLAGGWCG